MTKTALRSAIVAAFSFLLLGIAPSSAGDDAIRAEAYFHAITGGDAEIIASFYAENAEFRWIGGPLAGTYQGRDRIKGVWEKFAAAAGQFTHEVLELNETPAPKGKSSTVIARIAFKGETDVPVKFVMTYKDGKIASQTWQVDKIATIAKAEPKPEVKPETKAEAQPETIATIETQPEKTAEEPAAKTQTAAQPKPDYLPSAGAQAARGAGPKAAAPSEIKPAPKVKAADAKKSPRKKRTYYDDYYDDDRYEYGYGRYRGYRDYDGYRGGYGGGYRGYFGGGGFGFGGGYGRYGGGY